MDGRITRGTCSEPSKACLLERVETLGDEDARVQSLSGRPVEGRLWGGRCCWPGRGQGSCLCARAARLHHAGQIVMEKPHAQSRLCQ